MLRLEQVSVARPGEGSPLELLVNELNIEVPAGSGLGVIGPNGSGKSTLLMSITGLQSIASGKIRVDADAKIGYMPQNYRSGVLSWLTLDKHFDLTLDSEGREGANDFLAEIGFKPAGDRKLANMSGGEVQLIILATLIGQDCNLLLLDEPLSAIDFVRRRKALSRLRVELKDRKRCLVMVSHHLEDARYLCSNLVVLSGDPGTPHRTFSSAEDIDLMTIF